MTISPLPEDSRQKAHHIFLSFRKVQKMFYKIFTRIAEGHDLTPVQLMVMKHLHEHSGLSLSLLAKKMNITSSTMSGIVDRMVKSNLVTRKRLESDRRSITLSLTAYGEEIWYKTDEARTLLLSPITELPEEDLIHLLHTHEQIIQRLEQQLK